MNSSKSCGCTHTHTHTHVSSLIGENKESNKFEVIQNKKRDYFFAEEKGITLMILVITIIVMLILAGVTIKIVIGENGILSKVTDAAEKTNYANAVEDVEMAWSSLTTTYYDEKYTNDFNVSKTAIFTKDALNEELQLGKISNYSGYNLSGDTTFTYTLASTGKAYEMSIDTLGKVSANSDTGTTDITGMTEAELNEKINEIVESKISSAQPTGIKTDTYLLHTRTDTADNQSGVTSMTEVGGFTKTTDPSHNIDSYLSYSDTDGYKVLQSGWYFVKMYISLRVTPSIAGGQIASSFLKFWVNDKKMGECSTWAGWINDFINLDNNSFSIFLRKGDKIYFEAWGEYTSRENDVEAYVYPMF